MKLRLKRPKTNEEIKIKLMQSVILTDSGCLEWSGNKSPKGYGKIAYKYKHYRAHRLSYLLNKGEIPSGLYVLHSCDNPRCINPDHLFLGTDQDNKNDMVSKGRQNNQWNYRNKKEAHI